MQVRKLDRLIENKLIEKEQWKAIATGTVTNPEGDRVKSTGSKQKMADAICRYVDIEQEINEYIDRLVDTKQEVIKTIEQLDVVEYDLLHKIYIQGNGFDVVADMYDKSYSWVTTIHGRALKQVQDILENRKG